MHSHRYWKVGAPGWYQTNLEDHLYIAHNVSAGLPGDPQLLAQFHINIHAFDDEEITMPLARKNDPTIELTYDEGLLRGDLVEIRTVGTFAGFDEIKDKDVVKLFRDPAVPGAGVHVYYRGHVSLIRRSEPDYVAGRIYQDAHKTRFVFIEDKRWLAVDSSLGVYVSGRRITVGQFYAFDIPVRPLADLGYTRT